MSKAKSWGYWNSRVGVGVEKTEKFHSRGRGGFSIAFLFLFLTMKTKVTSKQNLEHFKMISRRLFTHKFCSNSKMLLSFSWAIFIRVVVFSFSPRANFSWFEYLCFSFLLIL